MISMSNISNDWIPVVEKTFSLSALQPCISNEPYSGLNSDSNTGASINTVNPKQMKKSKGRKTNKRIPLQNRLHSDNNLEGFIKLWTSGGHTNWLLNSSSKRKVKTLDELKQKLCIERLDIKLTGHCSFVKSLLEAVDGVTNAGVLVDWLLLKCEAAQMDLRSVYEEIAVYSTKSFNSLRNEVYNNSCLPLPLIHKCENEPYQYFYLAFNYCGNPKIAKLNNYLFKEKEGISIKGGIQLNNSYTNKVECYEFYGERGFDFFLMKNETYIKKLIFRHIVWGYLQSWVRKLVKLCRFVLTVEQVAEHLLICHVPPEDVEELKNAAATTRTVYLLGFCQHCFLYIKLFTLKSDQRSKHSITITNVETDFVSEIPIVQYFHQYFYVSRTSEASLLKAIAGITHEDANCLPHSSATGDYQDSLHLAPSQGRVIVRQDFVSEKPCANSNCTENVRESAVVPNSGAYVENPCFSKGFTPLIKTRTVEEINSSVENVGSSINSSLTDVPPQQCNTITKLLREGEITAQEVKYQLFPMVRDSLDACYLANMEEKSQKDESPDETFIRNCFSSAIATADKTKTFYVFLDQVFRSLQLHFTNSTCRRIMDLMIYDELRNKYSYVLDLDEGAPEPDAPRNEARLSEFKMWETLVDCESGCFGHKRQCAESRKEISEEMSSHHTGEVNQLGDRVNVLEKINDNLHSEPTIQKENKSFKEPEANEMCENELISSKASPKISSSDLDIMYRECLYNKVSVALLRVQDMIDLESYFKRKEELNAARKNGVKRKYKKRKHLRERVCVKKEATVKGGTIFRILKIGRRKSEYVKVEYETLAFLFKWKFRKKREKEKIL